MHDSSGLLGAVIEHSEAFPNRILKDHLLRPATAAPAERSDTAENGCQDVCLHVYRTSSSLQLRLSLFRWRASQHPLDALCSVTNETYCMLPLMNDVVH